jgi:hypothetical protein
MQTRLVRIVTNRERLDALYGGGYYNNLSPAVESWRSALAAKGIIIEEPFVFCDELPSFDLPQALKQRLACLNRKPADAVVILGGSEVVPFYPVCSPEFLVSADGDTTILSDDPYVAFDRHNVLYKPECPVGRLPDGGPSHPELLPSLLSSSANYHTNTIPAVPNPFGLCAQVWHEQSRQIFGFHGDSLYDSPPCTLPDCASSCADNCITPAWLEAHNLHYYNVRGTRSNTMWYGHCHLVPEAHDSPQDHLPVIEAEIIPSLSSAWVVSEAGYSASLVSSEDNNVALRFLTQGALCYVGASATTYCSNAHSLQAADRLTQLFFQGIHQNVNGSTQLSVGEMLKRSKLDYAAHDNFDRKTVIEFVLFGDPTLVPFQR